MKHDARRLGSVRPLPSLDRKLEMGYSTFKERRCNRIQLEKQNCRRNQLRPCTWQAEPPSRTDTRTHPQRCHLHPSPQDYKTINTRSGATLQNLRRTVCVSLSLFVSLIPCSPSFECFLNEKEKRDGRMEGWTDGRVLNNTRLLV